VVLSVFRMSMALVDLMMLIGVIAPCIAVDNSADNAPPNPIEEFNATMTMTMIARLQNLWGTGK